MLMFSCTICFLILECNPSVTIFANFKLFQIIYIYLFIFNVLILNLLAKIFFRRIILKFTKKKITFGELGGNFGTLFETLSKNKFL